MRAQRLAFDLGPNEASGLERFHHERVLADHGWDMAFWAVLDDVDVETALGVLGHRVDAPVDRGWTVERLHAVAPAGIGRTKDAEAVTTHVRDVYVFGSHFGSKDGPLQRERQFVARFDEGGVAAAFAGAPVELTVVRSGLHDGLHRVVNDGLAGAGIDLYPMGEATRAAFLTPDDDAPDDMIPHEGDHPINIEGAEFLSDGALLLGLRWPVAADGRPLVVTIDGLPGWIDGGRLPTVTAVHTLDAVGRGGRLAGIRDLMVIGGRLHAVTGNIDSRDKGSVLLEDHPDGAGTVSTHVVSPLPPREGSGALEAEVVGEFADLPRIEGIASRFGYVFYVSDEDDGVEVRYARLLPRT